MNKLLYFFLLILGISLQNCSEKEHIDPNIYFCDAENVALLSNQFVSNGHVFENAKGVTSDESYSGNQSCLVDSNYSSSMICIISDPKPGETFKISAFRKSNNNVGGIILTSTDLSIKKSQRISQGTKDNDGWEYLSFNVQLPMNYDTTMHLKIYVFNRNKNGEKAYFDDLKIVRVALKDSPNLGSSTLNQVKIQILDHDYSTLMAFRDQAIKQEIISNDLKKEFSGTLNYKNKTYRIGIRLKGDWADHLTGYKWSFRIKIKNKEAFMGLKSFSIQAPGVRSFLNEWVVHEICRKENLLTTKYEFLPVSINGRDFGIYNLEEHFEKQLLESKKRREGPILKFAEDGFWENNLYQKANKRDPNKPIYAEAPILPFKLKKTLKSEKLKNQFLVAQNLMLNYKIGSPNISNFMDIRKLAKTYALMSLFNIDHAYSWHNQRLYYNPVSSKLEPIVYDCYAGPGNEYHVPTRIIGNDSAGTNIITNPVTYLIKNNFDDPSFLKHYLAYLKKYSSTEYVNKMLESLNPSIDSLSSLLQQDYNHYSYDKDLLKVNAQKIREMLPSYEIKVKNNSVNYKYQAKIDTTCVEEFPFDNYSVNAHIENHNSNGKTILSLINYHCRPLLVVGYSNKSFPDSIIKLSQPVLLNQYSEESKPIEITIQHKPKLIYFKLEQENFDTIFSAKVKKWKRPQLKIPSAEIIGTKLALNPSLFQLKNDTLSFIKGRHIIKNSIIIPKGLTVEFFAGTELVFNNSAFFMSYSSINMLGEKNNPVKITSTDKSGNGFSVLQASGTSVLKNVIFEGLNTFDKNGWTLTGAVTFFESTVNISNCSFNRNYCEDALNIVSSNFDISDCTFSNIFSDGLDGDFCTGTVSNSSFNNTGNDCLDFSGSTVTISNCNINNSGDKGISCGEKSTISIVNVNLKDVIIGIASKDESNVTINNLNVENCGIGFSIFQKKPEYGGASILVKKHALKNTETDFYCQEGSSITFE